MYFIIISLLLIGLGFVFCYIRKHHSNRWDDWEILASICLAFGGVSLFFSLIFIPICRNSTMARIEVYEAIRQTIVVTRTMGETTDLERIRLTENTLCANKSIAVTKYYASHPWFKLYYPEEVLDVEMIY